VCCVLLSCLVLSACKSGDERRVQVSEQEEGMKRRYARRTTRTRRTGRKLSRAQFKHKNKIDGVGGASEVIPVARHPGSPVTTDVTPPELLVVEVGAGKTHVGPRFAPGLGAPPSHRLAVSPSLRCYYTTVVLC
jgi:hypothetical protein